MKKYIAMIVATLMLGGCFPLHHMSGGGGHGGGGQGGGGQGHGGGGQGGGQHDQRSR